MKYYLIAGEASGDMHGANLMKAIQKKDHQASFRVCGGGKMENAGGDIFLHYKDMAFMGFKEVLGNLHKIWKYLESCKKDILKNSPDVVVLIDYPGFNLRIAEFAKRKGFKVVWYISPQVWAWKASRVKKLQAYTDKMIVILPFEKDFYRKYNMDVHFVGHPLMDVTSYIQKDENFAERNGLSDKTVALLPGSRKQEISKMLPVMLQAADTFPGYQFVIAGAPSISEEFYQNILEGHPNTKLLKDDTYQLMLHSTAAVITSGTATLEAALLDLPQVVGYKSSELSYRLGKMLVNVKYISLVNLLLDKKAVEELIQSDFNTTNLTRHLKHLLESKFYREAIFEDYKKLRQHLGGSGASEKAAEIITSCKD